MPAKSFQSCVTLCDLMDCNLPGSSVHGISKGRILEWVAEPSSRDVPHSGIKPTSLMSPALAVGFFTTSATWKAQSDFKQDKGILQFWRSEVWDGLQDKIKVSAELHCFGSARDLFFPLSSFWRCPQYSVHITLTSASIIHLFLWLRPCCLPLIRTDYTGPRGQCRTLSPSQDPYLNGVFKAPSSCKVTYSQVLGSGRRYICRESYWPIRCINSLDSNLIRSVLLFHHVDKETEEQQ